MTGFSKCYTKCMQMSQRMAVTDTGYVSLPVSSSLSLTLSSGRSFPRYFGVPVPKGGALTFAFQGDVDTSPEFSTPARMCGKILSNIDYL